MTFNNACLIFIYDLLPIELKGNFMHVVFYHRLFGTVTLNIFNQVPHTISIGKIKGIRMQYRFVEWVIMRRDQCFAGHSFK